MAKGSADVQTLTGTEQTWRWNAAGPLGTPVVVTYSFATRPPEYETETTKGLVPFSAEHKRHIRAALDVWAQASGLTFVEVPQNAGLGGQMLFSMVDLSGYTVPGGGQVAGLGSFPSVREFGGIELEYTQLYGDSGGDIWLDKGLYASKGAKLKPGSDGFRVLLHEIGHAIGFKHPHDEDPILPASRDNLRHTVMTYNLNGPSPTRLGSLDIEAVRLYYGRADYRTKFDAAELTLEITGTNASQTILGTELADTLNGLSGHDILDGDLGNDRLFGGAGNDILKGDDGDDLLSGGAGGDMLIGGEGIDTATFADARKRVVIVLNTYSILSTGDAKGDIYDSIERYVGSRFNDRIEAEPTAWVELFGGEGDDLLVGSADPDLLDGGEGDDRLRGGDGNDQLFGGNGADILVGGQHKDILVGGGGADRFVFRMLEESIPAKTGRDVINDFRQDDADRIVLEAIDADTSRPRNNAFTFIGDAKFSGNASELRTLTKNNATIVYADVDGDGRADLGIKLVGVIALTAGDFVL